MRTSDFRAVDTAEAFVHLLHFRRERLGMIDRGNRFSFSLDAPSCMGPILDRALLLRGRRADGSTPGRHHRIDGEMYFRDDTRAWHRALYSRDVRDEVLEVAELLWASLDGRYRVLLSWAAGYADCGDEAASYAEMASHANRRGWRQQRGALISVDWIRNHLHAARKAVLQHPRFSDVMRLLSVE